MFCVQVKYKENYQSEKQLNHFDPVRTEQYQAGKAARELLNDVSRVLVQTFFVYSFICVFEEISSNCFLSLFDDFFIVFLNAIHSIFRFFDFESVLFKPVEKRTLGFELMQKIWHSFRVTSYVKHLICFFQWVYQRALQDLPSSATPVDDSITHQHHKAMKDLMSNVGVHFSPDTTTDDGWRMVIHNFPRCTKL